MAETSQRSLIFHWTATNADGESSIEVPYPEDIPDAYISVPGVKGFHFVASSTDGGRFYTNATFELTLTEDAVAADVAQAVEALDICGKASLDDRFPSPA